MAENEILTVSAHGKHKRSLRLLNKYDTLPVSIVVQGAVNENRVL